MKPTVGITMGDFNGVGPEVTLKALRRADVRRICNLVLIGSLDVYEWYAHRLGLRFLFQEVVRVPGKFFKQSLPVIHLGSFRKPSIRPGTVSVEAGSFAGESIETAVEHALRRRLDAIVTAPVSKEAMDRAGYNYPGQTEMLARLSGSSRAAMILVAGGFRVGLVTVHDPLKDVPRQIVKRVLLKKISIIHDSVKRDFAVPTPKIAVLALNPHGGENGLIGREEKTDILPAIQSLRMSKMRIDGPFPADGFFGSGSYAKYDAVVAMYHDQGLIPLKMAAFHVGVNFTAGLPLVRTSPDHGTAFDIAGRGIAKADSMVEAIKLAVRIARNRRR